MIGPTCHPGGVCGYGSPNDVCFIGIAPGADEWRNSKRPFTGQSGRLLDALLSAAGLSRDNVYTTNLICWWKDNPTPDEIAACAPRLQQELSLVQPKIIVLLGKLACESVLGIPFKKAQGAIIRKDGQLYLSTYHPAAALHPGKLLREKEQQIHAAMTMCRDILKLAGPYDKQWPQPMYQVINSPVLAQAVLDQLPRDQPIAIDIETDYDKEYEKEHPFDHDITCIGMGASTDTAYVLTQSALSGLRWPKCHWLFHNGVFDTQEIARRFGVWLSIEEDTMLQSYSCDERGIKLGVGLHHKLKNLAREWVGADFYEEDDHKLDGSSESLERLYEYNAKDVVYTYRLHQHFNEWQAREGSERMYRELLLPMANILARTQYRGIYVNRPYANEVFAILAKEYLSLQQKLAEFNVDVLGFPEFNVNSHRQVKMMLQYQGYDIEDTTKATLQDLLDKEPDGIPFIDMLQRYRTIDKLLRKDFRGVLDQIKYDGRVHPHAFLIGTVSGRLTYKAPSMNTLPKDKTVKDLGVVRKIFSATNDDYILVEVDYAAIEGWLGAYFSEDDVLLHDLQSGDWHSSVAESMFHVNKDTAKDRYEWLHLRDAAKHINYGSFFGEGAQGLTRRPPIGIGCDLATAQAYLSKWRAHYLKFVKYQKQQIALIGTVGCIETPFGRKRRFHYEINDHQARQAINYKIQSTANDYSFSSIIRLFYRLEQLDTHLLFIEHDAIYLEVNRKHLDEVLALVRYEMEQPPLPGLPSIHVEVDAGPNLAQLGKKCPACGEWSYMDRSCYTCNYSEKV